MASWAGASGLLHLTVFTDPEGACLFQGQPSQGEISFLDQGHRKRSTSLPEPADEAVIQKAKKTFLAVQHK